MASSGSAVWPPAASARSSASADAVATSTPMVWPPSKAISIRTCSFSATRDHLREHAVNGVRVDKCDFQAEEALPWLGVDQLRPLLREPLERGSDVADLIGDVVHP